MIEIIISIGWKRDPVETEDKDKPDEEKTNEEVEQEQLVSEEQRVDVKEVVESVVETVVEPVVEPVVETENSIGTDSKDVEIDMTASTDLAKETASV